MGAVVVAKMRPVRHSDYPPAMRLLRSAGYFETGNDRNHKTVTMRDYPLAIERIGGRITPEECQAGENFYETWHLAGLSGCLQSPGWERCSSSEYGDGTMPETDTAAFHREIYREKVRAMGILCANVVEWVVCWGVHIPILARRLAGFHDGQHGQCILEVRRRLKRGLISLAERDKRPAY